jgi:hypothetical protein
MVAAPYREGHPMTTFIRNGKKKHAQPTCGAEVNATQSAEPDGKSPAKRPGDETSKSQKRARNRARSGKADPRTSSDGSTPATKKSGCLALLTSTRGASIGELKQVTGWQTHSVRGFLSGEVRKRLGHTLVSETDEAGERRYRIVGASPAS